MDRQGHTAVGHWWRYPPLDINLRFYVRSAAFNPWKLVASTACAIATVTLATACQPLTKDVATPDSRRPVTLPTFDPPPESGNTSITVGQLRVRAPDKDAIVLVKRLESLQRNAFSGSYYKASERRHYLLAGDLEPVVRDGLHGTFDVDPASGRVARVTVRIGFANAVEGRRLCEEQQTTAVMAMALSVTGESDRVVEREYVGTGSQSECFFLREYPGEEAVSNALQVAFEEMMTKATTDRITFPASSSSN